MLNVRCWRSKQTPCCGDGFDPHVWSGRALQEGFVDLADVLASAIASTLWCRRFLAASIQDLGP